MDHHNVLTPGIPDYGTLTSTQQCFIIESNKSYRNLLIVKGLNSKQIEIYASIGKTSYEPGPKNSDYYSHSSEVGFSISPTDLQKYCGPFFEKNQLCNIYICLYGVEKEEYMVAYTYNNLPFTLKENKIFYGPLVIADNQDIHFIYHPSRNNPTDIEEYSSLYMSKLVSNLFEASDLKKVFPTLQNFQKESFSWGSNLIHYSREEVNKLKEPVLLISMTKTKDFSAPVQQLANSYYFEAFFSLDAGYELKELVRGAPRNAVVAFGQWTYFYFYNNDPYDGVYIGLDSLNGGDADLFMVRGREQRPTMNHFEAKSFQYKSCFIQYDMLSSTSTNYKSMRGFYVVGVFGSSSDQDAEFSIYWRHTSTKMRSVNINHEEKIIIEPHGKIYIDVFNFYKKDVSLIVDNHHNSLEVYFTTLDNEKQLKENQFELYPSREVNLKAFSFTKDSGISKVSLVKENDKTMTTCVW